MEGNGEEKLKTTKYFLSKFEHLGNINYEKTK